MRGCSSSEQGGSCRHTVPWLGAIYGGQKDLYDFHKTGFTAPWLTALLVAAGFGGIERVERFREVGAADASWSTAPFGTNVSLNMRAVAAGPPPPDSLFLRTQLERAFDRLHFVLMASMKVSTKARSHVMARRRARLERATSRRR